MPAVIVDIWDSHDINGTRLRRMTDEDEFFKGFSMRPSLVENGAWEMTLKRKVGFALVSSGVIGPENLVRIMLPELGTDYLWGGFFTNRVLEVLSEEEEAGEDWTFGGPGPMFYLHRAIMRAHQETNNGWNLDLDNGIWRWKESATAGRVLNQLLKETQERNPDFLPGLTKNFNNSTDSLGVTWTNELTPNDDEWEIAIGTDILTALREMQDAVDFDVLVNLGNEATPKFELQAFNAPYGRNLAATANDFSTGVLFKEGVNIATNMQAVGVAQRKATHVLVHGLEDAYAWVVKPSYSGGYRKAVFLDYGKTKNETILERRGLRFLRNQDLGEDEFEFQHPGGFDPTNGIYFPSLPSQSGHYWLGDTVTIKTGTDALWSQFDWHYEEERILAIRMELTDASDDDDPEKFARSWLIVPEFNVERDSGSSPTQAGNRAGGGGGGGGGCPVCLKLCLVGSLPEILHFWNAEAGSEAINWSPAGINSGSGQIEGSSCYALSTAPPGRQTSWAASPGVTYRVSGYITSDLAGQSGGPNPGGTVSITFLSHAPGTSGGEAGGVLQTDLLATAISGWVFFTADVVAPSGTQSAALLKGGTEGIHLDVLTVESVEGTPPSVNYIHPDLGGSSTRAARCDHKHHVLRDTAPTVNDDQTAGYRTGTIWLEVDDVDAPTTVISSSILLDQSTGAAVWEAFGGGGPGGGGGTAAVTVVIQGSGTVVPTGTKVRVRVPWAGTITRATLLADQSGSIVVDVWKDTFANYPPTDADSITASAPMTISSDDASEDSTLTGWTTALAEGDILIFNVDSATTIQQVTAVLEVTL